MLKIEPHGYLLKLVLKVVVYPVQKVEFKSTVVESMNDGSDVQYVLEVEEWKISLDLDSMLG